MFYRFPPLCASADVKSVVPAIILQITAEWWHLSILDLGSLIHESLLIGDS